MDIKDLKDKISVDDILNITNAIGIPKIDDGDDVIRFLTACHCGESYKLYFYKETKTFFCYTKCGSQDIFELVKNIKGISLADSIKWVKDFLGIKASENFKYGFNSENDDLDFLKYHHKKTELQEPKLKILDKGILELFHRMYHPFFYNDNIKFSTMDKYGIRYDIEKQRIIIPHYDMDNNLIAIRCRNTKQELIDCGLKYVPIKYKKVTLSAPISDYLFGLNFNLENIKKSKKVIIFESEKSVMQAEGYLKDNISVAMCSSNLSDWQIHLLETLGVEEVILALDKEYHDYMDKEYQRYMLKIKKSKIDRLKDKFKVSLMLDVTGVLGYKDSPSDKGKDIFEKLLNTRIEMR